MEKINIAELLKDCPQGMELDCTLFEGLEFDGIVDNEFLPIRCRIKNPKGGYTVYNFTKYGCWLDTDFAKCVIFPKGKTTWKEFRRYFNDGDIVATTAGTWIGITEGGESERFIPTYCVIMNDNTFETYFDIKEKWAFNRLATEEEKQKLFQVIKENGYRWNDKTKTLEKLPKFKDGDILVHTQNERLIISIYHNKVSEFIIKTHCILWDRDEGLSVNVDICCYADYVRLATEEEKQKLFQAIKANGYKWNAETKTLEKLIEPKFKVGDIVCDDKRVYHIYDIDDTHYKSIYIQDGNSLCWFFPIHTQDRYMSVNCCFWVGDRITDRNKFIYLIKEVTQTGYILKDVKNTKITFEEARLYFVKVDGKFDITTLKPFDKVLVRNTNGQVWTANFFSHVLNSISRLPITFVCVSCCPNQCIPYENNEHLLGKTDDCDEFYKTWEK